jgi:hypothetical protein
MIDKSDLAQIWDLLWPFIPPAVGAYFGLRYATEQSKKERITTWFCSAFLSLYLGAAIGEQWRLGNKATTATSILIAMLLSEVVGIVVAAARQWTTDPVGTFRRWRDAWLGRGGTG